jgi:hypothetical protein
MSTFNDTLSDLGEGLGNFLSQIKEPVGGFILYLAIIGGVVAIFLGIAWVIKHALKGGKEGKR